MLPAAAYTDPAVLAWERRHFFAESWACLGRVEDLATDDAGRPVTQRALVVGDIAVLLTVEGDVAAGDGTVRAFANTCRHRGHEVLPVGGTGTKRALTCPYHAWSYDLDGDVIAAPGFDDGADVRHERATASCSCPASTWHGWVFVNATGTAAPFDEHLGALDDAGRRRTPPSGSSGARGTRTRSRPTGRSSARTTTSATTAR